MPKTIHFIRHGQSLYNAADEVNSSGADHMIYDAPLSPLGERQADALQPRALALGAEAVITSPLTRAIQTTMRGFKGADTPVIVEALHREQLMASCDVGRSPGALARDFPQYAFDHLDDPWWHADESDPRAIQLEPIEIALGRVEAFRSWLRARPERVLAVVGHGTFFRHLTGHSFANCQVVTLTL